MVEFRTKEAFRICEHISKTLYEFETSRRAEHPVFSDVAKRTVSKIIQDDILNFEIGSKITELEGRIFMVNHPVLYGSRYVIAVLKDHVKPILPYISDTGGRAPESSIFGMALTIAGVLMIMTVYIRFRQVKNLIEERDLGVVTSRLNNSALYMGVLANTFGCLITANFQVTNALPVHIFGAMMCFGLLIVFQIVQVIISFRMYPTFGSKAVNIIRLIFALVSSIGLGINNIAGIISLMEYEGGDMMKWTKDEKGYFMHLTSVIVEYIVLFSTIFFITTFTGEFKMVHFQEPVLIVSYVPNGLERKICTSRVALEEV